MTNDVKRVIIDTDPGIDDIFALLIFLEAEKRNLIKIEAITVTGGNTSLENALKNTVRFLQVENRTDIPVYKGVKDPLLQNNAVYGTYFGKDGLGDIYENEPDLSDVKNETSPTAICRIINENPGKITLVCLAPLTNVALAAKLDSSIFDKLRECYIMGGNHQGRGNETACGEFNFYWDPEAAHIVLNSVSCPTTILPIEPCFKAEIDLNWRHHVLGKNRKMAFVNKAEESWYSFTLRDETSWIPADGFLAALILYPELILKKSDQHVTVELHGSFTRGQMVLDHLKNNKANVLVVEKIDKEFYKQVVLDFIQDK